MTQGLQRCSTLALCLVVVGGLAGCSSSVRSPTPTAEPASLTRSAAAFGGSWVNTEAKSTGITRLVIGTTATTISVHAFTACTVTGGTPTPAPVSQRPQPTPTLIQGDCDWGTRSGNYAGDPFVVTFDFGRVGIRQLTLNFKDDTRTTLVVEDSNGSSGRSTYLFVKN